MKVLAFDNLFSIEETKLEFYSWIQHILFQDERKLFRERVDSYN